MKGFVLAIGDITPAPNDKMFVCIITSGKNPVRTIKHIPVNTLVSVCNVPGLGLARNLATLPFLYSMPESALVVQMDDDLELNPAIWAWLQALNADEFAMCKVGKHLSTRIFAINTGDFIRLMGFDSEIKYVWEDGEFALRALESGMKLRIVPNALYKHIDHPRNRYQNLAGLDFEYARMLVKYKRHVFANLLEFFWRPFDWRIKFQDIVIKIPSVLYWMIRSWLKRI